MAAEAQGSGNKLKKMSKREYETQREWLIDTAETPKDQKNLKKDLADLNLTYRASNLDGYKNPVRQAGNGKPKVHPDNTGRRGK